MEKEDEFKLIKDNRGSYFFIYKSFFIEISETFYLDCGVFMYKEKEYDIYVGRHNPFLGHNNDYDIRKIEVFEVIFNKEIKEIFKKAFSILKECTIEREALNLHPINHILNKHGINTSSIMDNYKDTLKDFVNKVIEKYNLEENEI